MLRTGLLTTALVALMFSAACSGESTAKADAATDTSRKETTAMPDNYRNITFATITGDTTDLKAFDGKAILIVNTASECGYTPQYEGLEELYRTYKDSGLVVIGFPANNFGGQEPGTNEQILNFCTRKFDVTFPMMAKVSVKGNDKHPLFSYLTEKSALPGEIKWNFSKFVLDRQGKLVARFDSGVKPMSDELLTAVKKAL